MGIDIPNAVGLSDKTSLQDIKLAAQSIAKECVIKSLHLGGTLQIGWQNKLQVIIVSKDVPHVMGTKGNNSMVEIA